PLPGNEALSGATLADEEDDYGDGPAPGNEKYPAVQGGPNQSSGQRGKRRRRRKGRHADGRGDSSRGVVAAWGQKPEGTGQGHERGEKSAPGSERHRSGSKKSRHARGHARGREHREGSDGRERPAFSVGDIVFGKILEITDEAIFVDVSGKGRAIFD